MHEQQCQYQWKGGNAEKLVRSVGHLGLLLSDAIYGSLTNNALFLIPVNPGPFVPPPHRSHQSTNRRCKRCLERLQFNLPNLSCNWASPYCSGCFSHRPFLLNTATGRYATNIQGFKIWMILGASNKIWMILGASNLKVANWKCSYLKWTSGFKNKSQFSGSPLHSRKIGCSSSKELFYKKMASIACLYTRWHFAFWSTALCW